jgi:four helix bundle protein
MSYKNLEIWKLAREITIEIHELSLTLPKFEQYEEAQQIRRSSKSVRSNIVEGYGRRIYKGDFTRFIICALASNDETIDHLEMLQETHSLSDQQSYSRILAKLKSLGIKLSNFSRTIDKSHAKPQFYSDDTRG